MLYNALLSTFSDCCDSLEVYYNGPLEYTHSSIYGYYVRQDDFGNRPWYRNGGRSIWWDDESWVLGQTTEIASSSGYAFLDDDDGRCLTNIPNPEWKITLNGLSYTSDVGNKFKVRCGNKPKGKNKSLLLIAQRTKIEFFLPFPIHF